MIFLSCSSQVVDTGSEPVRHDLWHTLLQKHVKPNGRVDYKGFIKDSTLLNDYLKLLSNNHPNDKNWTKDEQLAYWINAYNAFTIKLVCEHYPVSSIKDIKPGIPFINSVWDIPFIQIEGQEYDLNNIEHSIIRGEFSEPRIHFALNCASYSCPNLSNEAYTADQLDEQLTIAAQSFLRDTSKNRLEQDDVQLSKIFLWYGRDFKKTGMSKIEYINQYTPLSIDEDASIDYLDYDWRLNE
jgi:hypothetical protein